MSFITMLMLIVMIIAGLCWVYDIVKLAPTRQKENKEETVFTSYSRGIFLILAIVLAIKFFSLDRRYHSMELQFISPALLELTADHIFYSKNKYTLIDYEVLLNFPVSSEFLLFRYKFHLINTLQQLIGSLASPNFVTVEYLKNLYIPQEWFTKYVLTPETRMLFLTLEERLQSYLNWERVDMVDFNAIGSLSYTTRMFPRITSGQLQELASCPTEVSELNRLQQQLESYKGMLTDIKSSRFFRLWQSYCNLRDRLLFRKR